MVTRRQLLLGALGAWSGPVLSGPDVGPASLPAGALEAATYDTLPGKLPLIRRTIRPPNFETPVRYFGEAFTPNDAFFVRYHLSHIPEVDPDAWRLRLGGEAAEGHLELSLAQLVREFETVELAAVCQCSGNRRGMSSPHVAGVQWGFGAMGNARWRGVRLRDVLQRLGVRPDAVEVAFDGADGAVADGTPDFVKSLPIAKALDPDTLIAFEMNGEPLPHWHGAPARLVVPGWTATYWMKHLTRIDVLAAPFKGFWMNPAYRLPRDRFSPAEPFVSQQNDQTTPITEMVVNSLITSLRERMMYRARTPLFVRGIAWDGGAGITRVEVSVDGGGAWADAELGPDHGRFSWRQWSLAFVPAPGEHVVMARATSARGETQGFEARFNPAGYHHNAVHAVRIRCT